MSDYQFIASDKPMQPFDNRVVNYGTDRKGVSCIRFQAGYNENDSIRIIEENDYKHARQYTEKKYINYIEWFYSDDNAQVVLEYIKEIMKDRFRLELYNIWLGDFNQ